MIVKDEELTLGRVLGDLSEVCDELVIVDTGSTDRTIEIARSFHANVYSFEWANDFSKARNYSLDQCHEDWVLWIDADDRVPPAAQDGLRQIHRDVASRSEIDAVAIPYRIKFAPDDPDVCGQSLNRERLFRNKPELRWSGVVHEMIEGLTIARMVFRTDAWVDHRPLPDHAERKTNRNLLLLESAFASGDRSGRTLSYLGMELSERERYSEGYALLEEAIPKIPDIDGKYDALCALANCAKHLGDEKRRIEALLHAIALRGTRSKAFILLGLVHYEKEEWSEAMPFFAAATVLKRPPESVGSELDPGYTWLPWDYLAVCASRLGDFEVSNAYALNALAGNPDRERVLANIRFNLEEIERATMRGPVSPPGGRFRLGM